MLLINKNGTDKVCKINCIQCSLFHSTQKQKGKILIEKTRKNLKLKLSAQFKCIILKESKDNKARSSPKL